MRRVVVTGLGVVSPIGDNAAQVTASLRAARSGIVAAPEYADLGFRCQVHGLPTIDWEPLIDRKAQRFLSSGLAYGHVAMQQAIADSGLDPGDVSHERTGLIVGSGGPSTRAIVEAADTVRNKGVKRIGPFAVPKAMSSGPSAVLSTWFKIHGINYSITSACATSAHCIGAAADQIALGRQDVMFAGGCEEVDCMFWALCEALGAMSSRFNDSPGTASRPYDVDRDGFVIGGGAGVVVLEDLEHAKARGARIYAEVVGHAATSDGYDMVAPSGEGAVRCMRLALQGAGNRKVDYLNAHGTGTPVGDEKEMGAVREVFGADLPLISSTKALTGHSLGAAGAHEAIYCLLMMADRFVAESANIQTLDPAFADLPIVRQRIDRPLETVMSNSFGFGGANGCLVLSRLDA